MSSTGRCGQSSIESRSDSALSLEDLIELVACDEFGVRNSAQKGPVSALWRADLVTEGRSASLRQVYDRTSAQIFGLALAVVRDVDSAEAVTREVFLEVWQTAGAFDRSVHSALEWMQLLTRVKSIECLHRRRLARPREQPVGIEMIGTTGPGLLASVVRQGSEYLMALRPLAAGLSAPR